VARRLYRRHLIVTFALLGTYLVRTVRQLAAIDCAGRSFIAQ